MRAFVLHPAITISRATRRYQNISAELRNFECHVLECFAALDGMEEVRPVLVDDLNNLLLQATVAFQKADVGFVNCIRKALTLPFRLRSLLEFGRSQALEIREEILFSSGVNA